MSRLTAKFFQRKTELVAKELLGKVLVRKIGHKKLSGIIVETEAYVGPHDAASHAFKGKTNRNQVMFFEGGFWYVYMIYGVYFNLNIVTEAKEYPAAILIRALEPLEGVEEMKKNRRVDKLTALASGPGKLCQALRIDKTLNCSSATNFGAKLFIEDRGIKIPPRKIVKAKRIGVDYAKEWKDKLLRYYVKDNLFVSRVAK